MTTNTHKIMDWLSLVIYIAFAIYFLIAAYGKYRTMFPRP